MQPLAAYHVKVQSLDYVTDICTSTQQLSRKAKCPDMSSTIKVMLGQLTASQQSDVQIKRITVCCMPYPVPSLVEQYPATLPGRT